MNIEQINAQLLRSYDGAMMLARDQVAYVEKKHPSTDRVYNAVRALAYFWDAVGVADAATSLNEPDSEAYTKWTLRVRDAMEHAARLEHQIEMSMSEADVHRDLCLTDTPRRMYHPEVLPLPPTVTAS